MEWLQSIRKSIEYMEGNLLSIKGAEEVADYVYMSPFYLQKGFKLMTGYSIAEYIRNRKLYLAALDIVNFNERIIDVAYKYGYDTPESFSKAFVRFHGYTPTQVKLDRTKAKVFLPLKITINITGGNVMNYNIEKLNGFKIIGFERIFSMDTCLGEIPKFWDEIYDTYMKDLFNGKEVINDIDKAIIKYCIGEFGVCVEDIPGEDKFRYIIGGAYDEGEVPEGMVIYEFPDLEWAKFSCVGPMPGALQTVNNQIFNEWLPGNPEFEIACGANIEWYSKEGNTTDVNYKSGIWIPVKRK